MPFNPDPSIAWLQATREQVIAVVESINQPQVSIPGKPPQQVSGHLCGLRNANGTLSIYVALHLAKSGENVVYVHDRRQLGVEEYREVEIEGLQFLESMGFMLDNVNFRNLSPDVQAETLKRVPLFSPPQAPGQRPAAGGSHAAEPDGARIARLLASF